MPQGHELFQVRNGAAFEGVPGGAAWIMREGQDVRDGDGDDAGGQGGRDARHGIFQRHAVVQAELGVLLLQELDGCQVGLRVRLPLRDGVPRDQEFEVGLGQACHDLPGQRGLGHGHKGAADAGVVQFVEQFAGPGPPGNRFPDLADHMPGEGVDDFASFHRHTGLLQEACGKHQGLSHELHGLLMGPPSAVGLHECAFGLDPVGLGVDDGAIHVPERCFKEGPGS